MKKIVSIYTLIGVFLFGSCNDFIDVIPDNVPVIEQAFNLRVMAQRYLATCYSGLPSSTSLGVSLNYVAADEFWMNSTANYSSGNYPAWYIAMGQQNANGPLLDFWGSSGSSLTWEAINNCNIFMERIYDVPDMDIGEKDMWAAEVKVLKAYYHFLLLRAYGPIIIRDQNIGVFEDTEQMHEFRQPVDSCFAYIVNTIDEAMPFLMETEIEGNSDVGRITQVVARTIKAQVLVEAASPLFNGNTDMAALTGAAGNTLFNQAYDISKWERAAVACKDAIDLAAAQGKRLHVWQPPANVTVQNQSTRYQMSYRTAFNESDANVEALWFDTGHIASGAFQVNFTPRGLHSNHGAGITSIMGATLNMVEKFYSKNGVPIDQDITYPYGSRYELVTVPNTDEYRYDLQAGYRTIRLHMDREPRFYGAVSLDGGRYFMAYNTNDNNATNTNYKTGGNVGPGAPVNFQITGYTVKKYVNYQTTYGSANVYTGRSFAIPYVRLADLYLLYAEALNESTGPSEEVYAYVDSVRARAGLEGVVASWQTYSSQPTLPSTQEGMRRIIKDERTIELSFEGKRFWDLRRWKDAVQELNVNISGWGVRQSTPETFYRQVLLFSRTFTTRDYFWPIAIDELRRNPNLQQNVGW